MVDFLQLRDARPDKLRAAAEAYESLGKVNGEHFEAVKEAARWISHGGKWTGTAAEAATKKLQQTNTRLDGSHKALHATAVLLREAGEAFELAQAKLHGAVDEAVRAGFTVGSDGSITYPAPTEADKHDGDYDAPKRAQALVNRINQALTEATSADQRVADRLGKITAGVKAGYELNPDAATTELDAIEELGRQLTAAGWPAKDASPAQVHDWWMGLSSVEQQRLIAEHPDQLGNRDGIPAAARNQANQILLPRLIEQYEKKEKTGHLSDAEKKKLEGFKDIQKRIDGKLPDGGGPGSNPPLLLLGIGDQGQGRAILSWGDPDKARNVSSMVPGLNSDLSGAGKGDASSALRVYRSAETAATDNHEPGGPSIASVFWLGYDAPQLDGPSVLTKERAVDGGAAYNQFITGLRASHEGWPAHMTSIGHSYGSLVVGQSTQRPGGLAADDIVLVGSPGVGVDKASKLGVGADHVYVGTAKADPVAAAPAPGMLVPGVAAYEALVHPDGSWHGTDPASQTFGGQRFAVADGTVDDSHDNYFGKRDKGGDSLANIGRIVSGHGSTITRQDPR
ncbi:alpha/beta hydrolase [Kitasatospora sp. NPDC056181]|uniref:alpha/beta hydrolase n=1 Tax=Kitasatospora sp. NPDC056181 TaxID=3345737 RepID=UPI0035DBDC7F